MATLTKLRLVRCLPVCMMTEPKGFCYASLKQQKSIYCMNLGLRSIIVPSINLRGSVTTQRQYTTNSTTPSTQSSARPPPSSAKIVKPISSTDNAECELPPKMKPEVSKTLTEAAGTKQKMTTAAMRQNVKGYVFTRYFDHVKNYDKVLEKNFPSAVKMYRVFFDGVKEFFADMKRYLKITRIANDSPLGLKSLNRKELELYMKLPRDMVKVAPAIIMSSLPVVGYIIFPLVVMYPRAFLTTHFWTLQQRVQFQDLKLKERLELNRPIFRLLQSKVQSIGDKVQIQKMERILGLIGSGFHPSNDLILDVKELFSKPPYSYKSLSGKHIKLLCQLHDVPGSWFRRLRLREHAFLLHYMDLAITREGDVHNLNQDALRYACYMRGLNPSNMANEDLIVWLRNWIKISAEIKEEHISLFLHLPIFMGYNHPNNWQLIYGKKHT